MKLNCTPGDLAVIVMGNGLDAVLIGKIIQVTEISQTTPSVCWSYEGRRLHTALGEVIGLNDAFLRPIRNDPEQDESLTWCDVPDGVAA